jgi:hypothetical protein
VNPLSEIDVDHWVDRSYSIESLAAEFQFAVGKAYLLRCLFFPSCNYGVGMWS